MGIIGLFVDVNPTDKAVINEISFRNGFLWKEFLSVSTLYVLWCTVGDYKRNIIRNRNTNKLED